MKGNKTLSSSTVGTIEIKCKRCGNTQEYTPRNPHKIPKYPHTQCANPDCNRNIAIKRSKLINSINFQKIPKWKNVRKKFPNGKNVRNLEILKLLDQGLYAQEISQKISLSAKNLSRIINSFEERGLIIQIQPYPKIYKLSKWGRSILAQGDLAQKRIEEYIPEEEDLPKGIFHIRVHKLRFKSKLIQKPAWISSIRSAQIEQQRSGLTIRKVELKNWNKYIIFFNYQDFHGLEKVEVCNNVIIYNFNRKKEEQFVFTKKELEDYLKERISDCKNARSFLTNRGFAIDINDPEFCQPPHFAVLSNGNPNTLGSLGKQLLLTVKTPSETREVDDSPKTEEGEEETDNLEKAKSYLDMPNKLEAIKTEISELKTAMVEMARGIKEGIKSVVDAFKGSPKPPEQEIEIKTNPGGMYR